MWPGRPAGNPRGAVGVSRGMCASRNLRAGGFALLAGLLTLLPSSAFAQVVRGAVAEQLSLAPVAGASVTLYRVEAGGELRSAAQARTDEEGIFELRAPGPGRYRVQAEIGGLSTPLSVELTLAGPGDEAETALVLPSPLLQSALTCSAEVGEGSAAIVGTVLDPESQVPLSGALVVASWKEGDQVRRLEAEADGAGRYRLCPPGGVGEVSFQTYLLGRWELHGSVELERPSVIIHDLEVAAPSARTVSEEVIRERILRQAEAKGLGDLTGQIRDRDTGAPLRFADVGLAGMARRAATDEAGRFSLVGLDPGTYTLEISSLGYAATSAPVEVPAGTEVFLDLRVAPEAVAIDGLTVTARAAAEEAVRASPFRRSIAYGEVMAAEERIGAMAIETLRRAAPGIRITERYREGAGREVCIETNRRVASLGARGCAQAEVVIDGMRVPDGADWLMRTPVELLESIEFVTPMQAQTLFGIGGRTANGVVVVYTRGRGPYASPLRNGGR